jgi:transcriptional regulator with XRE-family HTH domain
MPAPSVPLYDHRKLRAWRETAGLSPTQAAARIGVSYPWLIRMEAGGLGKQPSLAMLYRLAAAYGHHAAELLGGGAA